MATTITGSGVDKVIDGSITSTKIADGTITSTKILDGTITNADINASAAIVASKLSGVSSDMPSQSSAPSNPSVGNMYFDTDDLLAYIYDGYDWLAVKYKTVPYRYIRYTVVSASVSHHPRISRIYILEQSTQLLIYNNSSSDNCSDQGGIPGNGTTYTYDSGSGNTKNITGFGFYSVYAGGNRGSNIQLTGSNNNTTWTDIGSIVDAQTNSSCGELNFNI
jgi:hypothetical protein